MNTTLVAIGNSRGIRIPKVMLDESGIKKDVEIKVYRGSLRITPAKSISETAALSEKILREDWSRPEEDEAWKNL